MLFRCRLLIVVAMFGLVTAAATAADAKKPKIGLVLDKGGRDDKSFNASAFRGATEAQKKLGIELKVVESSDDAALEPSLRTFAQRGYDMIIAIGFVQADPVKKVAPEFPKTHFVLVDSLVDVPNVRSVIFNEHEAGFLAGAIAAWTTKSKTIGFIGGMDIPLIRRFELGYRAGAIAAVKGTTVLTNYVGSTSDAWRNPMKGKELALSQYQRNADIIFVPAGASAIGAFDAAEEKKKFIIGCDSNQNAIKPGRVLTSMLKNVDRAVMDAIESETKGSFKPGKFSVGLAEGGIGFAVDKDNRALLSPEVEKKANEMKDKIIKGKIKVPDFYENEKKTSKSS